MYVTVLKIDIPSLTDLDSDILISLKGPGLSFVGCMYDWCSGGRGFDPFFCGDGSRNHFYGYYLPTTDSSRAFVSNWRKDVHIILVNCLGLSLSRKSVV